MQKHIEEFICSKEKRFLVAEILACIAFILNTICVVTAKELHGPTAPPWLPDFNLLYWMKSMLALLGLIAFIFSKNIYSFNPIYIKISTLLLLLYSIPVVNSVLSLPFNLIFSFIENGLREGGTFGSRIPTQILWSVLMLIILVDIFKRNGRVKRD